jgi:hypothetical protein
LRAVILSGAKDLGSVVALDFEILRFAQDDGALSLVASPSRTILTGVSCMLVGVCLVFLPLVLGLGSLNRFIVTIGLLGFLTGASIAAHGVLDALRRH